MVERFAGGLTDPVMASGGGAIGQNGLPMIERHAYRQPIRVAMTEFTGVAGGRMVTGFAGGATGAIVATGIAAAAGKLAVIEVHLLPIAGAGVAGLARCGGGDMVDAFAGGDSAVMTARARCSGLTVVYGR